MRRVGGGSMMHGRQRRGRGKGRGGGAERGVRDGEDMCRERRGGM